MIELGIDEEEAVLGAILVRSECYQEAAVIIGESDFFLRKTV